MKIRKDLSYPNRVYVSGLLRAGISVPLRFLETEPDSRASKTPLRIPESLARGRVLREERETILREVSSVLRLDKRNLSRVEELGWKIVRFLVLKLTS